VGEGEKRLGRARQRPPARPDDVDLAHRLDARYARRRERARGELAPDRRSRDERDPESAGHRGLHGFLEPDLEAGLEIADAQARAPQLLLDHVADARALLHDDQALALQLVERDLPLRERVAGRDREDDLVPRKGLERERACAPERTDDAELERVVGDRVDDRVRVCDRESDVERRMRALEVAQEERDELRARAGRGADRQPAAQVARAVVRELCEKVLFGAEDALRAPVDPEARLRRLDPSAGPVEELSTEPLLERAHLQADRGLGHAEPFGGLGKALALDDGAECGELACIHISVHYARASIESRSVPEKRLRLLGVGDGRSLGFLRWGWSLAERGHEVHIVSNRLSERPGELDGLVVHRFADLDALARVPGLRRFRFPRAIADLARRLGADAVHAHYLLPYGYWAALSGAHPLVLSPWGTDILVHAQERRRGARRARRALAEGDAFVLSSEGNTEAAVRAGADPAKVRRIIWYADLEPFSPDKRAEGFPARFGWPDDSLIVLSLRNYRPDTNVDAIVRAFAGVAREEPRARLVLAARGGPMREEIERLVGALGLRDRVALHFARPDELPVLCASVDVAVSVAKSDATPASMLECMASGLPLVMGDAITIGEWIHPGEGGEIVPPRDEEAIGEAVLRLLRDPALRRRYGERNERVVRERVQPPGPALERLYLELVA
jgi:glycosyltransferase involved in cell wall biosynthesis